MRKEVADDLSRSAAAFERVVWPAVSPLIGGGQLVPVESVTAEGFTAVLDQVAGIDAWVVQQNRHIHGLASRVQWMPRGCAPFNTFTVRIARPRGAATEYQKRCEQIENGSLYPRWTCQAYLQEGTDGLLTAAVARTEDVIAAVTAKVGRSRSAYSGERFWAVPWRPLVQGGCQSLHYVDGSGRVWPAAA
jgi:hypothetical protein